MYEPAEQPMKLHSSLHTGFSSITSPDLLFKNVFSGFSSQSEQKRFCLLYFFCIIQSPSRVTRANAMSFYSLLIGWIHSNVYAFTNNLWQSVFCLISWKQPFSSECCTCSEDKKVDLEKVPQWQWEKQMCSLVSPWHYCL